MAQRIKRFLLGGTIFVVVALGCLLFPYESTVVPEWRVRAVNDQRAPLMNVTVTQYWRHMTIEPDDHRADAMTDNQGYVTFPRRTVRGSLLRRVFESLRNRLDLHGTDSGPHSYLIVSGDMNSTTDNSDYRPGKPLPQEIVRRPLR